MECYLMDWMESEALIDRVTKKIWKSGYAPDMIIGISRGGLVPARIIADQMGIRNLITIKIEHWGTAVQLEEARITGGVPEGTEVKGKRVLLVDDLTDTGESLEKAIEHVRSFAPAEVRTAVVEHKLSSKFEPDYYARKVEKWKWIIHPWAFQEDMVRFVGEAIGEGRTMGEIREWLRREYSLYLGNQVLGAVLRDMRYKGLAKGEERDGKTYWIKG